MIYKRIITGLLLAAGIFSLILFTSDNVFRWACSLLFLVVTYEWGGLLFSNNKAKWCYCFIMGFLLFLPNIGYWLIKSEDFIQIAFYLYAFITGWLMLLSFLIVIVLVIFNRDRTKINKTLLIAVISIITFTCKESLIVLNSFSSDFLIHLIFLVSLTDVGSYMVGKWIGYHKLSPVLSPNKTVEGALGGIAFATAYGTIFYVFTSSANVINWNYLLHVIFAIVCVSISAILGDLFVSLVKRRAGKKESGWLLPGHGGVLDRVDSYLLATYVFIMFLYLLS